MASLFLDPDSRRYHVRFRYGRRTFKRSLNTGDIKRARGAVARLDATLALLRSGRLQMPADADPAEFLLSDGTRTEPVFERRTQSLEELFDAYRQQRIPGVKELSTVKTEDLHLRHLARVLKQTTTVQAIKGSDLQAYVAQRLGEKCGDRLIAAETVRKELATLRVVWNWGKRQGLLEQPLPVSGLQYPKRDERQPYRTWQEITAIVARGGSLDQNWLASLARILTDSRHPVRGNSGEVMTILLSRVFELTGVHKRENCFTHMRWQEGPGRGDAIDRRIRCRVSGRQRLPTTDLRTLAER